MNEYFSKINTRFIFFAAFIICIFLRLPQWITYLSESSLNQMDTDFLYFHYLYTNIGEYSNTLMVAVVEKLISSFGFLLYLSSIFRDLGIENNTQLVVFYYLQIFLGFYGIYLVLTALRLSKIEIILILLFFLFSYFSQFGRYIGGPGFYNKVIVSIFSLSVCYVIIGYFVQGRVLVSYIISAVLMYVHPVYAMVFLLIHGSFILYNTAYNKNYTVKQFFTYNLAAVIALLPFVYNFLTNEQAVIDQGIGKEWWVYLKAKTSNPFPLQDGLLVVVPTFLVFGISYYILGVINKKDSLESFDRARWVFAAVMAAWVIQIVFTEIIEVSFVARLSLTRMTPFGLLFVVIAYTVFLLRNYQSDKTGLWIFLLFAPVLAIKTQILSPETIREISIDSPTLMMIHGGYWSDIAIYPDTLFLFLIVLAFGVQVKVFPQSIKLYNALALLLTLMLGVIIFFQIRAIFGENYSGKYLNLPLVIFLFLWALERVFKKLNVLSILSSSLNKHIIPIVTVVALAILLPPSLTSAKVLAKTNTETTEFEKMWSFIESNTHKNEMIAVIPFFDTRLYPVMPLRPIFIDWGDAQYVLYNTSALDDVVERISLIGMNMDKALKADRCQGAIQYVTPMCKRILFESLSQDYDKSWRKNITRMKEIAPNLSYVLLKTKYVIDGDQVLYSIGDISLLKI